MHVRAFQCGPLLQLDRYLNNTQALAMCLVTWCVAIWSYCTDIQGVRARGIQKYMLMIQYITNVLNLFSTVYTVTQKDFYARPCTSMWAPVVARQISKRYSSSCHVPSDVVRAIWSYCTDIQGVRARGIQKYMLMIQYLKALLTFWRRN